jgi:hypothetical protein
MNAATPIRLDSYSTFRGTTFHAKGNTTDNFGGKSDTLQLQTGRRIGYGTDMIGEIAVPVTGNISVLVPFLQYYSSLRFGQAIAPHQFAVESINTTTDVLTITAHPLAAGDAVYLHTEEAFPTLASGSVSNGTIYYAGNITTNTFKLYTNQSHATAGTGASLVDFSAAGTGTMWVLREFPLVITRRSGMKTTYRSVVPYKFPSIMANGGKLFMDGNLGFRAYPAIGTSPSGDGAGAFYTDASASFSSPGWDGNAALTSQNLSMQWGSTAPWDAVFGEEGAALSIEPELKAHGNGVWPHFKDTLEGFKATVRVRPLGISVPNLKALFATIPGAQTPVNDLVLTFGGYTWTFASAALLTPKEVIYSAKDTVSPELEFEMLGSASTDNKPGLTIA